MPDIQFQWLIFIEHLSKKLYLEYQTNIVGVIVWLTFFATTHTGYSN